MTQTAQLRPQRVALVAALARDRVIGRGNALPWDLPEDLRHFRALTMGHTIIMGRRTHESIGRPLPGRRNLVVSADPRFRPAAGCELLPSLGAALAACAGEQEVFVIGGAQIYAAALPLADRLYLTEIDAEFEADAFFPERPAEQWRETSRQPGRSAGGLDYAFVIYERQPALTQST
jgi:dihydrofolate reductase